MQLPIMGGFATSQHSHLQLETPLQVPNMVAVAPFVIPAGHPYSDAIRQIIPDIAKFAMSEVMANAQKNPLRVYMWNQMSYNGFNNNHVTNLVDMIVSKFLVDSYRFGNQLQHSQMLELIRNSVKVCCELYAVKNALEINPVLITPENQNNIMVMNQALMGLRRQVQELHQTLAQRTGRTTGVDMSGMTSFSNGGMSLNNAGGFGINLNQNSNQTDMADFALHAGGYVSALTASPSNVSHLSDSFGVLEDMDSFLSDSLPLPMSETVLPKPQVIQAEPVVPVPESLSSSTFQDEFGHTLKVVAVDEQQIIKYVKKFKPTKDKPYCLTMYKPSSEMLAAFADVQTGAVQIAVIGVDEMDRNKHKGNAQPSAHAGLLIPAELLDGDYVKSDPTIDKVFNIDKSKEQTKTIKLPVTESTHQQLSDAIYWQDSFESVLNYVQAELLFKKKQFSCMQKATVGVVRYMHPSVNSRFSKAINSKSLSTFISEVTEIKNHLDSISGDLSPMELKLTLQVIDDVVSKFTASVNRALRYNLGIHHEQLQITDIVSDYKELMQILYEDFEEAFHTAFKTHEPEIIESTLLAINDGEKTQLITTQYELPEDCSTDVFVGIEGHLVTAVAATPEMLNIGTLENEPMVIPKDNNDFHAFVKRMYTRADSNPLAFRNFIYTMDRQLFELHRPWMVPEQMESFIISKVW